MPLHDVMWPCWTSPAELRQLNEPPGALGGSFLEWIQDQRASEALPKKRTENTKETFAPKKQEQKGTSSHLLPPPHNEHLQHQLEHGPPVTVPPPYPTLFQLNRAHGQPLLPRSPARGPRPLRRPRPSPGGGDGGAGGVDWCLEELCGLAGFSQTGDGNATWVCPKYIIVYYIYIYYNT